MLNFQESLFHRTPPVAASESSFLFHYLDMHHESIELLRTSKFLLFREAVTRKCSVKKVFFAISQNSQENTCARVFLIKLQAEAGNFVKKETLAQVFSSEFWEISKNTFSYRTPPVTASVFRIIKQKLLKLNG